MREGYSVLHFEKQGRKKKNTNNKYELCGLNWIPRYPLWDEPSDAT